MTEDKKEIFWASDDSEWEVFDLQELLESGYRYILMETQDSTSYTSCSCCNEFTVTAWAMKEKP